MKEIKKKGIFSFLKPRLVEVTVALEEETERMSKTRREGVIAPVSAKTESDVAKTAPIAVPQSADV